MSILRIYTVPEPILRRKAKRVVNIDKSIQRLIDDMIETMRNASGAGLAAPQVGKSLRIAVLENFEGEEAIVLINPEMVKRGGERILTEGCLSIPGYHAEIKRSEWVKVKARNRKGIDIRIKGEGILGQALEHEIDHLNGILYIDRLESQDKLHKITEQDIDEAAESGNL